MIICKFLQIMWMENQKTKFNWGVTDTDIYSSCYTQVVPRWIVLLRSYPPIESCPFLGYSAPVTSPHSHSSVPNEMTIQPEDRNFLSPLQSPPARCFQPLLWNERGGIIHTFIHLSNKYFTGARVGTRDTTITRYIPALCVLTGWRGKASNQGRSNS